MRQHKRIINCVSDRDNSAGCQQLAPIFDSLSLFYIKQRQSFLSSNWENFKKARTWREIINEKFNIISDALDSSILVIADLNCDFELAIFVKFLIHARHEVENYWQKVV